VIRDNFIDDELILQGKQQFILFVILVTAMFFIHISYVEAKIGSYDNLKSIALDDEMCL